MGNKTKIRSVANAQNIVKGQKLVSWQILASQIFSDMKQNDIFTVLSPRQRGKSTFLQQVILYQAINHPLTTTIVISPVNSQNQRFFEQIRDAIIMSPLVKKCNESTLEIVFKNKSRVYFKSAEQRDRLRGFTAHLLLIDEAAYIDDDIYDIVLPYLNVTRGRLILTSTPRFKKGKFFEFYKRGVEGKEHYKYINVSNYDYHFFISDEQLLLYRESMPANAYKTEILGKFLANDEGVFGDYLKCIGECNDRKPCYVGVDWATTGEDSTILYALNKDMETVEILEYRNNDATVIIDEIAKYINTHKSIKTATVEINSIGSVYKDMLKKKLKNKTILKLFTTTNDTKRELVEKTAVCFQNKTITIPNNPKLLNQLGGFVAKLTKGGKLTYENVSASVHDDYIIALCLAVWSGNSTNGTYAVSVA